MFYTEKTAPIHCVYKWMVQFQKLTRNIFLTLHGQTYTVSSGNCPSFSWATSSSLSRAYCGAAGPDLWLQCSVSFVHGNHRSGHLKTEHTESLFLLRRHLWNWPSSPAVSTSERTPGSAWETWTVAAAGGVRFARVRREINFLLTFETAPFICKHPVYKLSKLKLLKVS